MLARWTNLTFAGRCIPAALAGTNRGSAQEQLALCLTSLERLELYRVANSVGIVD